MLPGVISPVKFAAQPCSASTNNLVKTPLPSSSEAYWSFVDAVKIVTPSDNTEWSLLDADAPAMPEWQLSNIIILFAAGELFAMMSTSDKDIPSSPLSESEVTK